MKNQDTNSKPFPNEKKLWIYIKKNAFTIFIVTFMLAMVLSPDFKAFTIRQLMVTGLFNPKIEQSQSDAAQGVPVEFDYFDERGVARNTASLKGKVVFINFWASWCAPCRAEFPSIQGLYDEFKDHPNVVFLLLNEDSDPSLGTNYLDKQHFTLPFYRVAGPVPSEVYQGVLPTTLVLDKEGKMRLHHTGFANYSAQKFRSQFQALITQ